MSDPVPLRTLQSGAEGRAGQALEGFRRSQDGWPSDRRVKTWWAIRARAFPARHGPVAWRRVALVACCCCCCCGGGLVAALSLLHAGQTRPFPAGSGDRAGEAAAVVVPPSASASEAAATSWNRLELADVGVVEVSANARFEVRDTDESRELRVAQGTLRAQVVHQDPEHPVVVVTPHLRVVVVGTRFDVRASADRSGVEVLEGRVRVESGAGVVSLGAGEAIASDDGRLQSAAPPSPAGAEDVRRAPEPAVGPSAASGGEPAATVADCTALTTERRRLDCLAALARGRNNLAAQNALYTLGQLAREARPEAALEHFREYQRRFPSGTLAAEAALREMELLERLNRAGEMLAAADHFTRAFAGDPRALGVATHRAELLCGLPGRAADARQAIDALAARPEPGARAAATRVSARCAAASPSPSPASPAALPPPDNRP